MGITVNAAAASVLIAPLCFYPLHSYSSCPKLNGSFTGPRALIQVSVELNNVGRPAFGAQLGSFVLAEVQR